MVRFWEETRKQIKNQILRTAICIRLKGYMCVCANRRKAGLSGQGFSAAQVKSESRGGTSSPSFSWASLSLRAISKSPQAKTMQTLISGRPLFEMPGGWHAEKGPACTGLSALITQAGPSREGTAQGVKGVQHSLEGPMLC